MRVSLQRVSARIDRLAKQAHLSEDDLLAKCEAMSDEELGIEYLRLIEWLSVRRLLSRVTTRSLRPLSVRNWLQKDCHPPCWKCAEAIGDGFDGFGCMRRTVH